MPQVQSLPALVGGLLGLAAVIAIAILVGSWAEPDFDARASTALLSMGSTPYVVALAVSFLPKGGARRALLLAAALTSLTFIVVLIFSGVGLIFAPATVALAIAAVRG